jgi:group I intron endonuclease
MPAGIYTITNLVDGKTYVGSAFCFDKRWTVHQSALKNGNHGNIHLQRAWDKFGHGAFEFKIALHCDRAFLEVWEQIAIDGFRNTIGVSMMYNLSPFSNRPPVYYGDENVSRKHPEKLRRGDSHPRRLHPERWALSTSKFPPPLSGEKHWQKKHPEKSRLARMKGVTTTREQGGYNYIARGNNHPRRLHPEKYAKVIGETHGHAKLTEADVLEIRRLFSEGFTRKQIAELYKDKVKLANIKHIINGRAWKHLLPHSG